jgi:chemotaxis protein methyltransferase CheR
MTPAEFQYLAELMKRRSGLALGANKMALVESRLAPLAERYGLKNIAELVRELQSGREPLAREAVDAMTTNETWFFRDQRPFDRFQDTMLPALMKRRAKTRHIRIWCAGAASGQEPYSLAMILHERKRELAGWNIEILATDINEEVLSRAREGLYHSFEARRGLSPTLLLRYFRQEVETWRLNPVIRNQVQFRHSNLLDSFAEFGVFDAVFCRNVLIYFDHAAKADVLGRLQAALAADGYLVLGAAETVLGLGSNFIPLQGARGVYVKAVNESANRLEALAG